jgi:hypothetical protein
LAEKKERKINSSIDCLKPQPKSSYPMVREDKPSGQTQIDAIHRTIGGASDTNKINFNQILEKRTKQGAEYGRISLTNRKSRLTVV